MKKWGWFAVVLIVIGLDQASKYRASVELMPYHPQSVCPMFNFTLAYNTGAAFSFLHNAGAWHRWFFAGFSFLMSVALVVWIIRLPSTARLQLAAFSLILGGAIGNLIDRACFGFVIDFIDIYYKQYHWPVFNIADSAICVGAVLLLLDLCKNR